VKNSNHLIRLPAFLVLATVALFAAACSSGADDPVADAVPRPVDGEAEEGLASTDSTEPDVLDLTAGPEPSTLAELEAVWAEHRAAVVDRLREGEYGVTDNVLTGPGDFVVDLDQCLAGWSGAEPATGTIEIVHVLSAADAGAYAMGAQAYFDHVNLQGGVGGRLIDYEVVDDELIPTKTIEAVDDRIDGRAIGITTFGTPTSQSVFDQLNRACIPQPFVGSAHPAWGDPRSHPWTLGLQLSYATETIHWGNWIKRNLTGELPVKVAALTIDNDYGRAYLAAFGQWAASNSDVVSEVVVVTHDPSAADVTAEIAEIRAEVPDVFLAVTAGSACGAAVDAGEAAGLNEITDARFLPTACTDPQRFLIPNDRDGGGYLAADGGVKAADDPLHENDLFVEFINGLLVDADIAPEQTALAGAGAGQFAWAYVEALRIAADLDGGVNRANFLLALRSLELRHPMVVAGIAFATDGSDDGYPIEGARMMRYSAGQQAWEKESLVVDLNRATPTCSWDGSDCS